MNDKKDNTNNNNDKAKTALSYLQNQNPQKKSNRYELDCPKCHEKSSAFIYEDAIEKYGILAKVRCNRQNDCGCTETIKNIFDIKVNPHKKQVNIKQSFAGHNIDADAMMDVGIINDKGEISIGKGMDGNPAYIRLSNHKKPKWMVPGTNIWNKEEKGSFFPAFHAGGETTLHVFGGVWDFLKAFQDGICCTTSIYGETTPPSIHDWRVFEPFAKVLISYDEDRTGIEGSRKIANAIKRKFPDKEVGIIRLNFTKDEIQKKNKDYCDYRAIYPKTSFFKIDPIFVDDPEESQDYHFLEKSGKTYLIKRKKNAKTGKTEETIKELCDFQLRYVKELRDDDEIVSFEYCIKKKGKTRHFKAEGSETSEIASFRKKLNSIMRVSYVATSIEIHSRYLTFIENISTPDEYYKTLYMGRLNNDVFIAKNKILNRGIKQYIAPKTNIKIDDSTFDKKYLESIEKVMPEQTWKLFGWAVASYFVKDIEEEYVPYFPLLFIGGDSGKGKGTIARFVQAFFGMHREKNTTFNFGARSTKVSFNRTSAKYMGLPLILNEYMPKEEINLSLLAYYDREGYNRGKSDNTLETFTSEINATVIITTTENIGGVKAKDVITRVVEVDMDRRVEDNKEITFLETNINKLSSLVPFLFNSITKDEIISEIQKAETDLRMSIQTKAENRTFKNFAIVAGCANLLLDKLGLPDLKPQIQNVEQDMIKQEQTISDADIARVFLDLVISEVRQGTISCQLAKIEQDLNTGAEILYMSALRYIIPQIKKSAKRIDIPISDPKRLAAKLGGVMRDLNAQQKSSRKLTGKSDKTWILEIPNGKYTKAQKVDLD